MRIFLLIPIPFVVTMAILGTLVTSVSDKGFTVPNDIESYSVEEQVDFGDRARKAERYELALQYCAKGEDSEDLITQLDALRCMAWSHEDTGNIDEALRYLSLVKSVKEAEGWDTKTTDEDIAELKKMR
jgi:hypothetical protein